MEKDVDLRENVGIGDENEINYRSFGKISYDSTLGAEAKVRMVMSSRRNLMMTF